MTISELSLLFLENKYNKISYNSYGNYQDRLKIINKYLGNIKLRDFRKDRINDFENYLNNERKWNHTFKPSNITINEIMNVLNQLPKAVINLVVKGVYKVEKWYYNKEKDRWSFEGVEIKDLEYLNKRIPPEKYRKKRQPSPTLYTF